METTHRTLLAIAAITLAGAAGCAADQPQGTSLGLDELRGETVGIQRDGVANHYPRVVDVAVSLPYRSAGCATLDPSVTMTLDGRAPAYEIARGGESPTPNFFGGVMCEVAASATFFLSDEGGPRIARFIQGDRVAEIEFEVPAVEQVQLVAPADGRAAPGDILTLNVPQSFYDSRHASKPTPHEMDRPGNLQDAVDFTYGLFRPAGADLADFNAGDLGSVGVGTDDVTVRVPTYAAPGAKTFYLTFMFTGDWTEAPIARCGWFAHCTGTARDNFGVLGPVDMVVVDGAAQ